MMLMKHQSHMGSLVTIADKNYRVSLKKRSFTRLAPKPLHKALLVLKMVHNDEDQSKTL